MITILSMFFTFITSYETAKFYILKEGLIRPDQDKIITRPSKDYDPANFGRISNEGLVNKPITTNNLTLILEKIIKPDPKILDNNESYVEWYVLKKENDGWHIDGQVIHYSFVVITFYSFGEIYASVRVKKDSIYNFDDDEIIWKKGDIENGKEFVYWYYNDDENYICINTETNRTFLANQNLSFYAIWKNIETQTFTSTESFTPSQTFSSTESFTPSQTFSSTESFTPSQTFSSTESFTSILEPSWLHYPTELVISTETSNFEPSSQIPSETSISTYFEPSSHILTELTYFEPLSPISTETSISAYFEPSSQIPSETSISAYFEPSSQMPSEPSTSISLISASSFMLTPTSSINSSSADSSGKTIVATVASSGITITILVLIISLCIYKKCKKRSEYSDIYQMDGLIGIL